MEISSSLKTSTGKYAYLSQGTKPLIQLFVIAATQKHDHLKVINWWLNRNVIEVNVLNAGFSSGFAMFEHTVIGLLNHHESTNHFLGNEGAVIIVLSEGMVDQFWNANGQFSDVHQSGFKTNRSIISNPHPTPFFSLQRSSKLVWRYLLFPGAHLHCVLFPEEPPSGDRTRGQEGAP